MRSRSILPHDSHLTCSINHHERADIRISKQIKPLSIISLYLALLMVFLVTSCASSSTKPRGEGIGFRLGTTNNKTQRPLKKIQTLQLMQQLIRMSNPKILFDSLYFINSMKLCLAIGQAAQQSSTLANRLKKTPHLL